MVTVCEWRQVFSRLDFALPGSLPACLPESLRYLSKPSLYQKTARRCPACNHRSSHSQPTFKKSPKLFTKWSFHKWNRNRGCTTAENLLRRHSRRFNSGNMYWLESLIDCPKKTGRVDFGTAKQVTSSLLRVGGRWVVMWPSSTCSTATGGVVGKWHQCTCETPDKRHIQTNLTRVLTWNETMWRDWPHFSVQHTTQRGKRLEEK